MPAPKASCFLSGLMAMGLAGCVHYTSAPLDPSERYASSTAGLRGGEALPAVLAEADVAHLILRNNPSLKAAAARRKEVQAQGKAGALLPNPSLSGSLGYLLSGAGNATAWTAGVAESVNGWITLRARRAEAKASLDEIDAALAWEAWQDVGKGRMLVADIVLGEQLLAVQTDLLDVLDRQWTAVRQARARGDIDTTLSNPMALALEDARSARLDTERTLADKRRELRNLMGLAFDAPLKLGALPMEPPLDPTAVQQAVDGMASHRPDLVALAMGYRAEDARFRQAILSQFPPLTVGYNASQDNSRVTNGGPAVTFDLPVFDQGRSHVEAAAASRQRLHDEYGHRIADATDEARALLVAYRHIQEQLSHAERFVADAADAPQAISQALDRGDIDRGTYTDIAVANLSRQITLLRGRLLLREQRIALETLLGMGLPAIHLLAGNP